MKLKLYFLLCACEKEKLTQTTKKSLLVLQKLQQSDTLNQVKNK